METLNCEFTNPVDYQGNPPTLPADFWQFKNVACEEVGVSSITDETYTAYVSTKINLADIFVIGFLILFSGYLIFKFIWDFVNPRIIKIRSRDDL